MKIAFLSRIKLSRGTELFLREVKAILQKLRTFSKKIRNKHGVLYDDSAGNSSQKSLLK